MKRYICLVLLTSCATASYPAGDPADAGPADAFSRIDARAVPDARVVDANPAAPPDAYVPPPPPPNPTCAEHNLPLVNPRFDSGPVVWTELGSYPIINAIEGAHTPPYLAWLGGELDYADALYQDVAVPAGSTQLRLSGQALIITNESGGDYDLINIELGDTNHNFLESLAVWSNTSAAADWSYFIVGSTQGYPGRTIRLFFSSSNDNMYSTSFYFDSLNLTALVCQ